MERGDTVAVIGLGIVGQLICQLVRCQGGVVFATDLLTERVALARETGAEYGIAGSGAIKSEILALTEGRGVDVAIVAAA